VEVRLLPRREGPPARAARAPGAGGRREERAPSEGPRLVPGGDGGHGRLMELLVPEWIRTLAPYAPGKPIEELERELGIRDSIKIASNENPLGPSPKALAAIRGALADLHRYPDGSAWQ